MKIGYCLSGGGARGIAHLGMIKVLDENNIHPTILSGASVGSIVGAFYASGYNPDEILKIIAATKLYRVLRPAFTLNGLLSLEKSIDFFLKYLPDDSFEKLRYPLYVNAVNLKTGKTVFFSEGRLIRPVLASSAIPVVFNPVEIEKELYIDGGVLNNLPVEPFIGKCDKIIGFHCNPIDNNFIQNSMRSLVERTFILTINMNVALHKSLCDVFLEPSELKKIAAFDFEKANEIFAIGYEYAKKQLSKIMDALSHE